MSLQLLMKIYKKTAPILRESGLIYQIRKLVLLKLSVLAMFYYCSYDG